jgi:hypothetical protein
VRGKSFLEWTRVVKSEDLEPVLAALLLRAPFFVKIVCEVGREALAPVSLAVIHEDAISPPAMGDLMP